MKRSSDRNIIDGQPLARPKVLGLQNDHIVVKKVRTCTTIAKQVHYKRMQVSELLKHNKI